MGSLLWAVLEVCFVMASVLATVFMLIGLVHAFVAKQLTGKWPHQSKDAKRIYDALNSCVTGDKSDGC